MFTVEQMQVPDILRFYAKDFKSSEIFDLNESIGRDSAGLKKQHVGEPVVPSPSISFISSPRSKVRDELMANKAAQPAHKGKEAQNLGSPNQTLYLKNLNDKIHKNELKRALYMLFTTYGPVLDIITVRKGSKGQSMRGQAHVVFRDVQTSTQALRALQGFDFLGKEMIITYARGQSQIIPKLRGTFEPVTTSTSTADASTLQTSIFNAPPPNIPSKPTENGTKSIEATTEPHSLKRPREEEDENDDEASMDEDDSDASMEEDDDD